MNAKVLLVMTVLAAWCLCVSGADADGAKTNANLATVRLTEKSPASDPPIAVVRSTNGITLGVRIFDPKFGASSTESSIGLLFKTVTNTVSELFMPKDEYLVRLDLYDSSGSSVSKTELGSKYGRTFDELQWGIKKYAKQPHGPSNIRDVWSWGTLLPSASQLFNIKKPGVYHLRLEVQVMLSYLNVEKKQVRQILRFEPVETTITCSKPAMVEK